MYANEQQTRALDPKRFFWGPQGLRVLTTFLLGHTQTIERVWTAWGPNPEEGQMVPGIEGRTLISMRKERLT